MIEHRLLIDTDPGVDDALALLMALAHARTEVVALTVTAGNVGLSHTVRNALKLLEVAAAAEVPVFAGCATPLVRMAEDAAYVHGENGFGDTGYTPADRAQRDEHAALAMLRLTREQPGQLTLVMLGPLTNLALALRLDPTLPERVKRLVIMGGAVTGHGNISATAEFNIGFDPEAAAVVFGAWPRFELVDWEATLRHNFTYSDFALWLQTGSRRAAFYDDISQKTRAWCRQFEGERWHSADGLAMAVVLEPGAVIEAVERRVDIELIGAHTRGATVVDWSGRSQRPANARIIGRVDQQRFEQLIRDALAAG